MASKKYKSLLTGTQFRAFRTSLGNLADTTRILEEKKFIQHGITSVYEHCIRVALSSLSVARFFRMKIDEQSLIRGALLHDYFLYDWHDKKTRPHLHGYFHPRLALNHAKEDCELNSIEQDIIIHHMFPLTFPPPKTKEGFCVCIADKICSLGETFKICRKKSYL